MSTDRNGTAAYQLWEAHEDRIQQIERDRIEIAKEVAEQTATLKAIKEDINELAGYSKDTYKTINQMLSTIQTHIVQDDSRFSALESAHKPKQLNKINEIWAQWWGKILFAATTAIGGALMSLIMEHLSNH
jgi:septal ring factor EnvC (AmiA/AmiB activator)